MTRKCPGCGAPFQSEKIDQAGYLPSGMDPEGKVCRRCFRLTHYREYQKEPIDEEHLQKQLQILSKNCRALFLLCEVWSADEPLGALEWLAKAHCPVFLLATKADLLSGFLNEAQMKAWICAQTGLPNRQVRVISVKKGDSLKELRFFLQDRFDQTDRVAFLGRPNAGKSTLLNALLRQDCATASPLPGTTLGVTEYQMADGPILVDVPGLSGDAPLANRLCKNCLTSLTPSGRLATVDLRVKPGQTLMLGGLAALDITEVETTALHLGAFCSGNVTLHLTKTEKAAELLQNRRTDVITPPCEACADILHKEPMEEYDAVLHPGIDLLIEEVGWISVFGGHAKGVIRLISPCKLRIRGQLVPPPRTRRH